MLKHRPSLIALALLAILLMLTAFVIVRTNPQGWTRDEIFKLATGLNEAAAIGVPHGFLMDKTIRTAHISLLDKVENGAVLTPFESGAYRRIFQTVLLENQRFLAFFDAQLTVLPDHAMTDDNNIGGKGIAGHHDHHDRSARDNFVAMLGSLDGLAAATTPFGRIYFSNAAYKDLVDLISHLGIAPHSVSIGHLPPSKPWANVALGVDFEAMLKAYKDAQFEPINSPGYWAAIDRALEHYTALILKVQALVIANTSPWERKVAGRFLSVQTLAPPVDLALKSRRK